ncbi:MAG: ribosomal subunit interface protein [Actinobacteria bacterium HGW-Actinobacteria-7]|nr:MAG: ribosomal subunit interface protein [Actinobacteria bacterium HGW-Actinobacteria-7]
MQIKITGRHIPVTEPIRAYAEEKVSKAAKVHDREDMTVDVILHVEKNPSNKNRDVAEVTARMKGIVVRAEEAAPDMYAAIDLVSEKLERQMRKYKTKLMDRRNGKMSVRTVAGGSELPDPFADEEEPEGVLVRTKYIDTKPMSEDEAILQLELLGHDFFVFTHAEDGAVSVMYRRMDGDYGLIQSRA